jgi:hypothetical protein
MRSGPPDAFRKVRIEVFPELALLVVVSIVVTRAWIAVSIWQNRADYQKLMQQALDAKIWNILCLYTWSAFCTAYACNGITALNSCLSQEFPCTPIIACFLHCKRLLFQLCDLYRGHGLSIAQEAVYALALRQS